MSEIERSVDRREETTVTQEPGYAATEQVTRDVAAERRLRLALITQIAWAVLVLLQMLLGLRFLLKLIAANPDSGFAVIIHGITEPFIAPFALLVGTPTAGGVILEVTTLIAMVIYALFFWGIVSVIRVVMNRPVARTSTRSTRERMPGGSEERTTHITTRG